ncbi:MAG: hypothetical protein AAGF24_09960 [Cyanobacteria bacterium P01_H01_bin.121]
MQNLTITWTTLKRATGAWLNASMTVFAATALNMTLATAAIAAPVLEAPITATGTGSDLASSTDTQSYLYGEVAEPEQIGHTYIVLEQAGQQVVGAFYQPRSSYDCFVGRVEADRLNLTVTATYTNEIFAYQIALADSTAIASLNSTQLISPERLIQPDGFELLPELSANDQRILSTCKAASRG